MNFQTGRGHGTISSARKRIAPLAFFAIYAAGAAFPFAPAYAQCTPGGGCADAPIFLDSLAGADSSRANGVSADGSVVVGTASLPPMETRAFRWTSSGGTVSLGTLGGDYSSATEVSADGTTVVGAASTSGGDLRAFRWTSGGGMVDLGTLGGPDSLARDVNADGSVVVGSSNLVGNSSFHAYRWTSGGMVNLGTLGGDWSSADAVNGDGSVVVGESRTTNNAAVRAFRWTSGGGLVDLGTLGGTDSRANEVSADGAVVVGSSEIAGDVAHRAFRWTAGGGMENIGTLGVQSFAYGVNADGSVIVGTLGMVSGDPDSERAFRWTASGGMQDLNTLLSNAGVNMSGVVLTEATAVSGNGQFIVGQEGTFSGGVARAYIVRYTDMQVGMTTPGAVQSSINTLAETRFGVLAQQHGFAAPLLGLDKPMGGESEAGAFVAGGSVSGGGFARHNLGNGVSILGGLSYAKEDYPDADLSKGFTGALAVQYLYTATGAWRPFVEAGGWLTPDADLTFSRTYANGAGTATGRGDTQGDLSYLYARAGVLLAAATNDQLALSAELGRERLEVDGYTERIAGNPFEAHVASGTDESDLVKARLQWSHRFTANLDSTLWVAAVHAFNRESGLEASVPGIGALTPAGLDNISWAEYGARVGYKVSDAVTLDLFMNGVSGEAAVDTRVHAGAGLRFQY